MKILSLVIALTCSLTCISQSEFDKQIKAVADSISIRIISAVPDPINSETSGFVNKKVAVFLFENSDGNVSQLGDFLAEEVTSELINLSIKSKKYLVIQRTNLELIFKEKALLEKKNIKALSKALGDLKVADLLISARIFNFDKQYRVTFSITDTRDGEMLGAYKTAFNSNEELNSYYSKIIRPSGEVASYLPDAQNNSTKFVGESSCETANTGDICFRNDSKSKKTIAIYEENRPIEYNYNGVNGNQNRRFTRPLSPGAGTRNNGWNTSNGTGWSTSNGTGWSTSNGTGWSTSNGTGWNNNSNTQLINESVKLIVSSINTRPQNYVAVNENNQNTFLKITVNENETGCFKSLPVKVVKLKIYTEKNGVINYNSIEYRQEVVSKCMTIDNSDPIIIK